MTYDELYNLICKKYHLVKRPTNEELDILLQKLIAVYNKNGSVSDNELLQIINTTFQNHSMYINDSIDMTAAINIANQIIDKYKKSIQG